MQATEEPKEKGLYPPVDPYHVFGFPCHNFHELYVELTGNPLGTPVLFLHGGQYFNPQRYRIVIFHQRGAGRSKPAASLEDNDTWSLIFDIEKIRKHCNIERWVVFGGSWGSTLALAYAIEHPYRVKAMILRGVELNWYYQEGGASNIFPDYWEDFVRIIPPEERNDMIAAYYKRLTGTDEKVMLEAAMAWSRWEMATSKLEVDEKLLKKVQDPMWALQFARIECHYFINKGFFKTDNHILDNIEKINHIPCHIIQGRYGSLILI
ncbi:hypothetical protein HK103_000455 [Boothiomyces macroporosus]|uniref:AB hydrolase-1 domain-containing protein n=1 Tax=Boothiomyces macroporosus TaxID=261099 RepID=A0AAD5UCC8_9FUNG|nr:hypothetical protein HK103_000455 [Boothiomyces macroporosus]